MADLRLSVPELIGTIKNYVVPEKHEQLDEVCKRDTSKQLGMQQQVSCAWLAAY